MKLISESCYCDYLGKMVSWSAAMVVATTFFGCCPQEETGKVELSSDEAETNQPAAMAAPASDGAILSANQALVQVFSYGLGVVRFEPDHRESPEKVTIHLPDAPEHEKQLHRGVDLNGAGLTWTKILESTPLGNSPIDLQKTKITFPGLNSPKLEARQSDSTLGELPASPEEAEDSRWLISADTFDGSSTFQPSTAETRIEFAAGVLESCGLAHSANIQEVCRLETNDGAFKRAATEYTVVRYLVPMSMPTIDLNLSTEGRSDRLVKIKPRGGVRSVVFQNKKYSKIFDILIVNLQRPDHHSGRILDGQHLKNFQVNFASAGTWSLRSPDCKDDRGDSCRSCVSGLQPACLDYLDDYSGEPSGANRPLCPIVGDP